ncbi:ABC transporter substrate-binding protein [Paenarthrobacter sp. A20]|uniref:ABC transporter substrate-binding protein n=1 Tax=Paenarthrobacter sp. A20 TaxID=2817891 RepID=UPI00209D489E|nr:ABC transporter substrate-binding protein [Paenarthrobacter sp. A20]MCP1415751.1 peptide/nickel transport system substrate-binding protein [Paenarthrobacter sp. A20]
MQNNAITTTVIIAAIALAASGCTTGGKQAPAAGETPGAAGVLSTDTVNAAIDIPATFDPTQSLSLPDFTAARMSFDTLLRVGKDNDLVPGLAEEWDSKGTKTTFTLRDGATCSDGTPISATVVKNSLEHLAAPDTAYTGANDTFGITGLPTIAADDAANKVTIDLAAPWPDMLRMLSTAGSGIICPAGLKDTKALAAGTAKGAESGPYLLTEKEHGVRYIYALRDGYDMWPKYKEPLPGSPAKNVVFNVISDRNAVANQLLGGQLDTGFINPSSIPRFKDEPRFVVAKQPFSDFYVLFNERKGSPFADEAKRRAVAQILNRETFEKITDEGAGQTSTQLVADGTTCSNPAQSPVIPLDPEAAKSVLSGVKIKFVGTQVVGPKGSGNVYVEEQLRAAGADVTLSNLDLGGWIGTVYGKPGDWDMTVYAGLNFAGSMSSKLNDLSGPDVQAGGANVGANVNPTLDAALARFRSATDESAQCAALQEGMNSAISQANAVPLTNSPLVMVARDGFAAVSQGLSLDDQSLRITK